MSERLSEKEFAELNALLNEADLSNVSSEGANKELKDGYYLSEVKSAELVTAKKTGKAQVKLTLVTKEDGYNDDNGELVKVKGTANIYIYKYYSLADIRKIEMFASDMLKFEAEPGTPLLPKEAFKRADTLEEALALLEGMQIYVNASNTLDEDGKIINTWYNLISWKRAALLELPID